MFDAVVSCDACSCSTWILSCLLPSFLCQISLAFIPPRKHQDYLKMDDKNESAVSDDFLDESEITYASPPETTGWIDSVRKALPVVNVAVPTFARSRVFDYGSISTDLRDTPGGISRSSFISGIMSPLTGMRRPELGDVFEADDDGVVRTAEIAANSPRYRRRSSTFIDGVHDLTSDHDGKNSMAPAQLYSTMSGRLFHSGRIAIVLVGPPARGKT